jgi:Holliday junction DNA helicase RuvA
MISYLEGRVVLSQLGFVIIEVNGVGYKVFVSPNLSLEHKAVAEIFTYEHIREDADDFYGFLTYPELELFEKLISVNGVGPKVGLNIMSSAKADRIISAITSDDINFFTSIPGIGKKVAAKIILELKSKISLDKSVNVIGKMDDSDDLCDALLALGYKKTELQGIITMIPVEITDTEDKVRWCLKKLARF